MTIQSRKRCSSEVTAGRVDWSLTDLVDIEILLEEDVKADRDHPGCLRDRDRRIYNEFAKRSGNGKFENRRRLFYFWLDQRRRDRFLGKPSPGEEIFSVIFWTRTALLLAGILAARLAVWSFFRGAATTAFRPEPIDVLGFASTCIAIPFALSLYGFWVLLGQRAIPNLPSAPAFLRGSVFDLIQPLLRIVLRTSEGIDPEKHLNARAMIGVLKQHIASRKNIISATLFQLVQAFGLAFTIGVLFFSWLDCLFHSRIFGWQTTFRWMTADAVYHLLKVLATPWGWFHSQGIGYPTLAQVQQTNFIRGEDLSTFPSEAAPVWATFLIWTAFIYGFVPRLLLKLLSAWQLHAALRDENFEEPRFDALCERMTREQVVIRHPDPETEQSAATTAAFNERANLPEVEAAAYRVILPDEIYTKERASKISEWSRTQKGWDTPEIMVMRPGVPEKKQLIEDLKTCAQGRSRVKILIVRESFMPPVQDFLDFVKNIRSAIGRESSILVGLVGKPDGTPLARPPKISEDDVWRKKIAALGDPNLGVVPLRGPE
jgi:Protein of unknown function (DUF2868)